MKKLTDAASKLNTIFIIMEKVLFALAIAAAVCTGLILLGWLLRLDPDTIATGYESLDIGFLELQIADSFGPDKWVVLLQAAVILALCSSCCLVARRMVLCISGILSPISEGQPFHETISSNLKKLAILSIVLGVLFNLFGIAELLFATFAYDLPGLLISQKITHIDINYTIDISFLVVSGILLLLSYIFHYGSELQQLSDETL
jgi:hypothetical protein